MVGTYPPSADPWGSPDGRELGTGREMGTGQSEPTIWPPVFAPKIDGG